jgi:hypothetical protein
MADNKEISVKHCVTEEKYVKMRNLVKDYATSLD